MSGHLSNQSGPRLDPIVSPDHKAMLMCRWDTMQNDSLWCGTVLQDSSCKLHNPLVTHQFPGSLLWVGHSQHSIRWQVLWMLGYTDLSGDQSWVRKCLAACKCLFFQWKSKMHWTVQHSCTGALIRAMGALPGSRIWMWDQFVQNEGLMRTLFCSVFHSFFFFLNQWAINYIPKAVLDECLSCGFYTFEHEQPLL